MTMLDRQIRRTQHRLWTNRFFGYLSFSLCIAAGVFGLVVLIQRLFDLPVPLMWVGVGGGVAALLASTIALSIKREDPAVAAARLDQAAGLKERISSGQYCHDVDDPFAAAVVADAERIGGSLSVRQHIRFEMPKTLAMSAIAMVAAAGMFLITPGLLKPEETKQSEERVVEARQAKIAVKRKLDSLRKMVEDVPVLDDFKDDLNNLDKRSGAALQRPEDVRHEAVKRIDKLADAVKQKRQSAKYDAVSETRKMLRRLKVPKSSDAPTQKLAKALSKGDFKSAKEEINAIKEALATLKTEQDKEMVEKLSKKLEELAKQIEKVAEDKNLAQKLEQAGIKKEDIERLTENLKKKDLDQLKKQLEEKGFSQQQINSIAKQLQKRQKAGSTGKQLAKSLQQGAQCKNPGQMGEAMAGLSQAADQLSSLEALEQEMNQLDSTMSELNSAKNDLDKPCPSCNGTGMAGGKKCGTCGGSGSKPGNSGMGRKMGKGRGGLAPEQQTDVGFKTERTKVHTGKGATIGQFSFSGEQVKGEISSSISEVVTAAEREASDRINRDRVPRQYQGAIKKYFSNVKRSLKEGDAPAPAGSEDTPSKKPDESTTEDAPASENDKPD